MTHFIAIASAKGGVGKTVTAINLTSALNEFSRSTLLIDCDLTKPNVGLYLGMEDTPASIHTVLAGHHTVEEAIIAHPSGLHIMPGSISEHDLHKELDKKDIAVIFGKLMRKAEIILVDTPGNDDAKEIITGCSGAIIVTTPDYVAVHDAAKTAKKIRGLGKKVLGVVVTHTRNRDIDTPLDQIESLLGTPVIGNIPYDEELHKAHYFKHPVTYAHHQTPATLAYKKLAANLIGAKYEPEISSKESVLTYVMQRLGFSDPKR